MELRMLSMPSVAEVSPEVGLFVGDAGGVTPRLLLIIRYCPTQGGNYFLPTAAGRRSLRLFETDIATP